LPRYEFDGRFAFPDSPTQVSFATAVQTYIDNNQATFFGYTPVNSSINYHGVPMQHVQARFSNRAALGSLFDALKAQAQSRGAIPPSTMWLKTVADAGGVTEAVGADAPSWTDYAIA
jgi:hypothetical protein